jgi:hypothetical protein
VLVIATTAVAASATAANAGTSATAGGADASGCQASAAAALAQADAVGATSARPSASVVAAVAAYKAAHDTEAANLRALSAANVAHDAEKNALIKSGQLKLKAPQDKRFSCAAVVPGFAPDATVSWLSQYGQVTGSFCGPASVAEVSATVPGPSPFNLNQWSAAAYMDGNGGNSINARGTNIDEEVNGLNHFIGVPDFGRNYYGFVGMDYNPTSAQRSAFEANLATDVSQRSSVVGDAWETAGGPHLVGHPVGQTIFHYFQIGGSSGSSLYYSDSATTVWSSVPAYSWEDLSTVETILGGRGYIW